ncbi:ABC transporter permease [Gaopeijia maritima]|uniref:ABC transporter permease n=1 Tax=Gaopeijia maritima TaxID=3119007 RepID=UPI0032431952
MSDVPPAGWWYRLLLRLQPRSVRRDFGEEWLETARLRDEAAARGGRISWMVHRSREGGGALIAAFAGRGARAGEAGMLERSRQDLRFGWRSLVRSPGFLIMAVAVLGTGIGAATTIFGGVNAVLLAPLPFDEPDRLVDLWESNPDFGWEQAPVAPANMLDWRERVEAFADVAAYRGGSMGGVTWIDGEGRPNRLATVQVTGNLFDLLGLRPHLGTFPTFSDSWADGEPWVVVSHEFWSQRLGADPDAVGTSMELDGARARVRAVLSRGARFPTDQADLWVPYGWARSAPQEAWFRRAHFVQAVARLAPGASVEEARSQLGVVATRLQSEHPDLNRNMGAGLTPLRDQLVADLAGPLRTLMAGVLLLLVLACVNVGNLFLTRAVGRSDELSLRRAIGAGPGRIVGQLLAEATIVAALGGLLGIGLSLIGIRALQALHPLGVAGVTAVAVDGRVLLFALTVSLGSVLLFGLGPSLRAAGRALPVGLTRGGRGGTGPGGRGRGRGLVPIQTALAVMLLLAAGLVTRSLGRLVAQDAGIQPAGVWTFDLSVPESRYPDRDAVLGFFDRVVGEVEAIPGVTRAALTGGLPLTFSGWTSGLVARDWEPGRVAFEIRHRASSPGYFEVMGVPLLEGRTFRPADGLTDEPVAIVNRTFAERYFAGEEVLGRLVTFEREPTESSVWRTVVGVVGDERQGSLRLPADPEVWQPMPQDWGRARTVVLKLEGESAELRRALEGAVGAVDPLVPLGSLRSMDEIVNEASADARFLSLLLGLFAMLAVVLAAVGVYGVTAEVVRRRVPEFGVRMALGASRTEVVRMVLGRAAAPAGLGVLAGTGIALLGAGVLEGLLFDVRVRDPLSFTAAPTALFLVAIAAAWGPAQRAAGADPMRSLRAE